jgi:hypothetical protein
MRRRDRFFIYPRQESYSAHYLAFHHEPLYTDDDTPNPESSSPEFDVWNNSSLSRAAKIEKRLERYLEHEDDMLKVSAFTLVAHLIHSRKHKL